MTTPTSSTAPGVPLTIALYVLARLGLVAVVTAVMMLAGVPFLISLLVAFIVALPLSMVLFRGLRARLDTALAVAGQRRSAEREALRARLRGEDVEGAAGSAEEAKRQPDSSGG
ncbi:DUF4229 domain-containing protein [Pseudonocardia sp. GCM10023141]|uniref:DUF4229 domain-containing protein n=1 Tax=Pseudonocardia sp. GCM10023141 TaxID=3252653 RepID=UPI003622504E